MQGELVEVPKVLGDLLESILGAVFLDSGHRLAAVWNVFRFFIVTPFLVTLISILRKLCPDMHTICGSSGNVNYKRQLKERFPEPAYQVDLNVVQQDAIFLATVTIIFEVDGEELKVQKRGKGLNKRNAELAACKMVLKSMEDA